MGMQDMRENVLEEKSKFVKPDDRYHTLFERVNAAVLLTSFEGQIQEANQKSCEFLGYDWDELLRLTLQDVLSKEFDWKQYHDELAARGYMTFESETVCKNGDHFPVDVNISIFRMNGKLVMLAFLWDITQRKNQEKRLKESEKRYHGLFEYSTDGILVLDGHGDILDINTRMCEILDIMKSSVINKNLFSMDLLTAKSLPVVIQQFEQLLSEKITASYTTEIKNRQGRILNVEISSFFLVKKDNEVDNFILIVRDITSRNEVELRHSREQEMLTTLMDNVPDLVSFKDDQNRFILVNKAKAALSKVTAEEMVGKTDFNFLPTDQAQKAFDEDNKILQTGQSIINGIEKITDSNGSEQWYSVTKVPRYDLEGRIIGLLSILRNITESKKLE
jgi:two-component system sensor histidine kinase/response regulator